MFLFDETSIIILLLALAADAYFGDPQALWERIPHPVVLAGRLIAFLDRRLNRSQKRDEGIKAVEFLIFVAAMIGLAIYLLARFHPMGILLEIAVVTVLLAQRSLYHHVDAVALAFREGGLDAARDAVSHIVGRDPEQLDKAGVCRAAIETAAENFSDGVVAPAFWYLVGGLPGMMVYKAVNTADSMIGHHTPRYEEFGWAAARLDDWMNHVPARISAALIWVSALLAGRDWLGAVRAVREDAPLHRSPNAGWPEAAMAGALGLALAGPRHYESGMVEDAWMNKNGDRDATQEDIRNALEVYVNSCYVHGGAVVLLAVFLFLI